MDDLRKIRNIGIAAHIDAGKTTTTERVLYYSGTIHKMGDVDEGTTITDFDVEEQQRGITIYSAAVSFSWRDCRVNLIDTPGHVDFTAEVERSLRVLDGAVVVFDVKEGVEAQSETVWRQADKYRVPRICFLNKMDKTGADFPHALATIRERLHANPIAVQIPVGSEQTFRGYIDLIRMKAAIYEGGDGTKYNVADIPDPLHDEARQYRHILEERVAELDETLMSKYINGEPMAAEEIRAALRRGTIALACQPVFCGSSLRYMGVQGLLDGVCDYLPSPVDIPPVVGHDPDRPERLVQRKCDPGEPMAALVFKIVADPHSDLYFLRVYSGVLRAGSRVLNVGRRKKENLPKLFRVFAKRREQIAEAHCGDIVAAIGLKDTLTGDTITDTHGGILLERIEFPETVISLAIEPQSSADRDKLLAALQMLARSDPTFRFRADLETGQTIISGMGELHLETRCNYLKRELGVPVRVGKPRVAYRETIATVGEGEGQLIRQPSQGKGQFAIVRLRVEPFVPSAGQENVQFLSALPDKIIRPEYVAAIEHGVRSSASTGVLGGYPMINVRITLFGAQEHTTDSSDAAFEGAAGIAFRRACEHASPALLEPIMKVEVVTPEEYFGPINSDLMARRAMIVDTGMRAKNHVIHAEAPLSTMFGYATQVRSLSQGRASYSMEPCRYEKMPPELVRQVLGAI